MKRQPTFWLAIQIRTNFSAHRRPDKWLAADRVLHRQRQQGSRSVRHLWRRLFRIQSLPGFLELACVAPRQDSFADARGTTTDQAGGSGVVNCRQFWPLLFDTCDGIARSADRLRRVELYGVSGRHADLWLCHFAAILSAISWCRRRSTLTACEWPQHTGGLGHAIIPVFNPLQPIRYSVLEEGIAFDRLDRRDHRHFDGRWGSGLRLALVDPFWSVCLFQTGRRNSSLLGLVMVSLPGDCRSWPGHVLWLPVADCRLLTDRGL